MSSRVPALRWGRDAGVALADALRAAFGAVRPAAGPRRNRALGLTAETR